jgi:hypothetical protein
MIILYLIVSMAAWLVTSMVFEAFYKTMKPSYSGKLQKHQWCWIWWSLLGVLSFAAGGPSGMLQMAMIFCIAAGHIRLCGVKEEVVSPVEILRNIPAALREVYEKFRRI